MKQNIFVSVTDKVGSILDISAHGLSFSIDADEHFSAGETLHLDIFGGEDTSFTIKNIPFQIASETMLNPASPFSIVTRKRYGIKFCDLDDKLKSQLEYFILRCLPGNA